MAKASTPVNVTSKAGGTNTEVTVEWNSTKTNYVAGNGKFAIQFVSRSNPSNIVTPTQASYQPTAPTGDNPYSQSVTLESAEIAGKIPSDYQAQVMALADTATDNSDWGKQIYWQFGFSITVIIGSYSLTLRQIPGSVVYVLPVTPENPLTITYGDMKTFAQQFLPANYGFPTDFPNGQPINSALQINRFAIDTGNKLLDLDVKAVINWTVFTGFTVNAIGLALQRTNGTPIQG